MVLKKKFISVSKLYIQRIKHLENNNYIPIKLKIDGFKVNKKERKNFFKSKKLQDFQLLEEEQGVLFRLYTQRQFQNFNNITINDFLVIKNKKKYKEFKTLFFVVDFEPTLEVAFLTTPFFTQSEVAQGNIKLVNFPKSSKSDKDFIFVKPSLINLPALTEKWKQTTNKSLLSFLRLLLYFPKFSLLKDIKAKKKAAKYLPLIPVQLSLLKRFKKSLIGEFNESFIFLLTYQVWYLNFRLRRKFFFFYRFRRRRKLRKKKKIRKFSRLKLYKKLRRFRLRQLLLPRLDRLRFYFFKRFYFRYLVKNTIGQIFYLQAFFIKLKFFSREKNRIAPKKALKGLFFSMQLSNKKSLF